MAAQKVKSQPIPEDFTLPKLTAEQRKQIFAPKPASSAPRQLQGGQWVSAWKTATRLTYGLTAITALFFGGVIAKESRKGLKP